MVLQRRGVVEYVRFMVFVATSRSGQALQESGQKATAPPETSEYDSGNFALTGSRQDFEVALCTEAVIVPAVTKGTANRGGVETRNEGLSIMSSEKGSGTSSTVD